jgi:hypothetical protein
MEAQWQADRATLRTLLRTQPHWTLADLAQAVGRSLSWVKKWVKRLRTAAVGDLQVLRSRSRARRHPPASLSPLVVERILAIRYYLEQEQELRERGAYLPRSTRTIWRLLRTHGRILPPEQRVHQPVERPDPLTSWQLDFKDVSTVPADPDGKHAHVVEVLDAVDVGTSILLDAQVHEDFSAETALEAVARIVQCYGLPVQVTVDRDPVSWAANNSATSPRPSCASGSAWGSRSRSARPAAPT